MGANFFAAQPQNPWGEMSRQLGQTPGQLSGLAIRTTLGQQPHRRTSRSKGGWEDEKKKKKKRFDRTWDGPNLNLNKQITETGTPKPLSAFAAALGDRRALNRNWHGQQGGDLSRCIIIHVSRQSGGCERKFLFSFCFPHTGGFGRSSAGSSGKRRRRIFWLDARGGWREATLYIVRR